MANQNTLTVYASLQKIILNTNDTDKLLSNLIENAYTQLPSIGLNPLYLCGIFLDENHQIMNLCIRDSRHTTDSLDSLHESEGIYAKINSLLNKTGDGKNLAEGKIVTVEDIKAILPDSFIEPEKVKSIHLLPIIINNRLSGIVVYGLEKPNLTDEEVMLLHAITDLAGSAYKVKDTQDSLTDITQELYKTNIQLRQLDKMKDQLIAVTSHELRTPATVVQNYLWMMTNKPDAETKLGPKDKERLQNSFISIQTLIRLISDILDVSKIESNRLEINIQEIDYDQLVTSIVKEVMPRIETKNLTIVVNKAPDILTKIATDGTRLKEILMNLLTNAIKFTEKGGIVINIKQINQEIVFEVKDTGRGISPSFMPFLFKKFHREDTALTASNADTGGTGLGLYITKSLIELLHGTINVQSELGKGTTFTFTLPATKATETNTGTSVTVVSPAGVIKKEDYLRKYQGDLKDQPPSNRKRILLVEDDPDMQDMYREYLTDIYDITIAKNGIDAFERMEHETFDLILLDIMMPRMDGVTFLEKKKEHQKHFDIPVVLLTNLGSQDVLKKCVELGAKSTIMKSDITPDQIPPILDKLLIPSSK